MIKVIVGILVVAAVTTAGDYVWFEIGVQHRMMAGVIHGMVLLTTVGAVLGATAGRLLRGLPIGTIAGVGGALTYYGLTGIGRTAAMIVAWAMCWLILAALDGRFLRQPVRSGVEIVGRGLGAAILGGLAFWFVLDTVWGHESATGRNYLMQFLAWTVAWTPGIVAIAAGPSRR